MRMQTRTEVHTQGRSAFVLAVRHMESIGWAVRQIVALMGGYVVVYEREVDTQEGTR